MLYPQPSTLSDSNRYLTIGGLRSKPTLGWKCTGVSDDHFCRLLCRCCRFNCLRASFPIPENISLVRSSAAHHQRADPMKPRQHRKTASSNLLRVSLVCHQTGLPFVLVFD